MAITTIKSTYSLDARTVRALDRLARRWRVTKSEALRRVIQAAASGELTVDANPVAVFRDAQRRLGLTREEADRWLSDVKAERSARSGAGRRK